MNCFAIDRCQRLEPEKIERGGVFSPRAFPGGVPWLPGVLGVLVGWVLCCATLCFAGATFVKCTVDELVGEKPEMVENGMMVREEGQMAREQDELEFALLQNTSAGEEEEGSGADARGKSDLDLMRSEQASVTQSSRMAVTSNRPPTSHSFHRMYCVCQICYLVTILTSGILFTVGLAYAPRQLEYNVCTDQLAWKSIVEGMASLKMSASFDLLISVYNPNRFEVDLSNGSGQFHHDGEYIGSFIIPEGVISARAVSDLVVKVNFTPDKWSALSLTSEYYQGTLKFVVGGHTHVKIPGLGNYQYDAKFNDITVNVNDPTLHDTHLCACPGWKRPKLPW